MDTSRFADDLRLIPETLDALADALEVGLPGLDRLPDAGRVLVLGMGSSRFAAEVVARRARARGLAVAVEYASARELPPPADDLAVVAVSATGGSVEVLDAMSRYEGNGRLIALTNRQDSEVAQRADVVVPLLAGVEQSGVACRTFRATTAVLDELLRRWSPSAGRRVSTVTREAAAASAQLLDRRGEWLDEVSRLLLGPDGTWVLAPVERLASAQQAALMMREVPRRPAHACETGDWSHVDVYLSKTLDYRALVMTGSAWDQQAVDWMSGRGATWVSVGEPVSGSAAAVRFAGDDDPEIAVLTEVLVAELVAEAWRARWPDFGWSARV